MKELFEDHSREEIEELLDAWMERDFEDISTDTFFAALGESRSHRHYNVLR